jgi:hypothetical protein
LATWRGADEGAMSERMVDVFVNEELIKSYRISLRVPYVAPDSQFVAEAKKHLG